MSEEQRPDEEILVEFEEEESENFSPVPQDDSKKSMAERAEHVKQASEKVAKAGKHVAKAGKAILALGVKGLVVAAVVLLAIFLIAFLVSIPQVIGHNENTDGCIPGSGAAAGGSGVTVNVANTKSREEVGNALGAWLMSTPFAFNGNKPLTLQQAAAIAGNFNQESQLNPTLTQSNWISSSASNAEVLAKGGSGGGKAIGLVQWDSDRRVALLKFAEGQKKHWSDLNVQMSYLKQELDSSYEAGRLVQLGFNQPGKDIPFYTHAFDRAFERSGTPMLENRIKYANDFVKYFKGSGAVETGGSCLNGGGMGSFDSSSLVNLAVSISYKTTAESRVAPGDPMGMRIAPDAYKAAKAEAEKKGGDDTYGAPGELYASCDRFVATVIKNTLDPEIPWGSTTEQHRYLANSPKWKIYHSKAEAQPGDIWVTKTNGHIVLYLGQVNGQDTIAHASYQSRVGALGSASYLSSNLVDTGGRAYDGFHFVGNAPSGTAPKVTDDKKK